MKKVKLKERIENAFEAFFDEENLGENNSITTISDSKIIQNNFANSFSDKGDFLIKILKQIFLFFPGVLYLFGLSSVLTFVPIVNLYNTARIDNWTLWLVIYLVSFLMVWFGVGDIKKLKHLIIPLSVSFTGLISGIITALITIGFNLFPLKDDMTIYFLPIALIIPFLLKIFLDKEEKI